ncbi:MAG: thiamine ABC transporter substrate-binding protein [Acidimicrobiia bacterium]|nr:thiamine ABC transporter substrate-binding protein [Acidimicrobiia bacterium]
MSTNRRGTVVAVMTLALTVALTLVVAACSSSAPSNTAAVSPGVVDGALVRFDEPVTLRVLAHDSFAVSAEVIEEFERETNVRVELVQAGDAVTMTNAAILTAGNPVADVIFGIDENLLGSVSAARLVVPYDAVRLADVDPAYASVVTDGLVTPIDHAEVCVNFDRDAFTSSGRSLPRAFEDLTAPDHAGQLVVQDPASSTPGLAFMLATIARFGGGDDTSADAAWLRYWKALKANGVKVVDGWETAYYGEFSGGSGEGTRPLVVSYASSPPAEVSDTSADVDATPTGVITSTCYRQIEFAGILRGARHPEAAATFIEFMLGRSFQADMPLQMYVYPVVSGTPLPDTFAKYTAVVDEPLSLPYEQVAANRDRWVGQWSALFR